MRTLRWSRTFLLLGSLLAVASIEPARAEPSARSVPTFDPKDPRALAWVGRKFPEVLKAKPAHDLVRRLRLWAGRGESLTLYATLPSVGVRCGRFVAKRTEKGFAGPLFTSSEINGSRRTDHGFDVSFGADISPAKSGMADYELDSRGQWKLVSVSEIADGWLDEPFELGYVDSGVARYDASRYRFEAFACKEKRTLGKRCSDGAVCERCMTSIEEVTSNTVIRLGRIGTLGCIASCPDAGPTAEERAHVDFANRVLATRWFVRYAARERAAAFYRSKARCLWESRPETTVCAGQRVSSKTIRREGNARFERRRHPCVRSASPLRSSCCSSVCRRRRPRVAARRSSCSA